MKGKILQMNLLIKKIKRFRNKMYYYILGKNKIKIKGHKNYINKNDSSYIKNTHILIYGNNNNITFHDDCTVAGLRILIIGDNNLIEFGKGTRVNASTFQPTVMNALGGKSIIIGEGSLFSNNIEIHTTDYHGIYNSKGERINSDKNILIGKHVWIGLGTKVLKGTEIADGCVVGAGSVLSGLYQKENTVIAGNPAKTIKEQIFWQDDLKTFCEVPNILKEKWNIK